MIGAHGKTDDKKLMFAEAEIKTSLYLPVS